MCSIGGWIAEHPIPATTAKRLSSALLWYGRPRGSQSAGIQLVGPVLDNQLLKRATDPASFILLDDFGLLFPADAEFTSALTHTRAPTSGGLGDAQAQPFTASECSTIHNGMFFDEQSLIDRWNIDNESGVDSELVTSFLATHGPLLLPDFVESTIGPSSIAARYKDDLYLIRSGNPCYWQTLLTPERTKICIFASTAEQLSAALAYTWLIPDRFSEPLETTEGVLIHMTPEGPTEISEPISHHDQGWSQWLHDDGWDLPGCAYGEHYGNHGDYEAPDNILSRKIAQLYHSSTSNDRKVHDAGKKRKESRPDRRYKGNRHSHRP